MVMLRDHLEAIRDRHHRFVDTHGDATDVCWECQELNWPCPDYEDAVASLEILNEREPVYLGHKPFRLIPEPNAPAERPS